MSKCSNCQASFGGRDASDGCTSDEMEDGF